AAVGELEREKNKSVNNIASLAVDPMVFRKGIGTKLLQHLISLSRGRKITVSTASSNFPAINLYKKLGFTLLKKSKVEGELVIVTLCRDERIKAGRVGIRTADQADAEAIVKVHFAAVQETAGPFYPIDILADWSPEPDEKRRRRIRDALSKGEELFLVAEDRSGIIGFGVIVPGAQELRALYVHPRAGRRGIGKRLLDELERQAILRRVPVLRMDASLNAEAFYRKHGYQTLGPGTHPLWNGREMECVKMQKTLG
ncbi:MAG TPA: GNAT family N-acetyltransferase, partial [Elusimicrobiota bacterium]|nr:GNAT family N-acetyltransferase [Elusimicrobiota bacterium]